MTDFDEDDIPDDFRDAHRHTCPKCWTMFFCYWHCPQDTPNKLCFDCDLEAHEKTN